jgi:hypothetical protein
MGARLFVQALLAGTVLVSPWWSFCRIHRRR